MARLYTVLSVHVSCFVRISGGLCGPDGEDYDLLAAGNGPLGVQLVDGLAFGSPVQGQDSGAEGFTYLERHFVTHNGDF